MQLSENGNTISQYIHTITVSSQYLNRLRGTDYPVIVNISIFFSFFSFI